MEHRLKLSYEELLRILDHSFDEILVFDSEGNVVYVNASCMNHYGKQAEDMLGKLSKELVEQNLWGPRLSPLSQQYKKRLTMEQMSCTGVKLLTTATPIFNENGEIEYIIENVRDITEGHGLKEELEVSRDFLAEVTDYVVRQRTEEFTIRNFVAKSDIMQEIIKKSWRIAEVNSNVLITGESGTGKGVIARYIHDCSPRKRGSFVGINCAALPESLIESELFGYRKGAFSGAASKGKIGLIRTAEKGTLFLDEIGELPLSVQAKLLHFIQDGTYFEVGGTQERQADCRIIAATNRDLRHMVEQGKFREDLYYRLKVFEISIPPLSERVDDIIPLINFFLQKYNGKYELNQQLSKESIDLLVNYHWPGNVRELANVIEQVVVMSTRGTITPQDLPINIRQNEESHITSSEKSTNSSDSEEMSDHPSCYQRFCRCQEQADAIKRDIIRQLYKELGSSRKVAKELHISQSTAYRYIQSYCKDLLQ